MKISNLYVSYIITYLAEYCIQEIKLRYINNKFIRARIERDVASNYSEVDGRIERSYLQNGLVSNARASERLRPYREENEWYTSAARDAAAPNGGIEATSRFSWPRLISSFRRTKNHTTRKVGI